MSQARIDDLADRLLSRKLALCLLMIGLALIGFWSGHLTFPELMTAAITAAGVYSATNVAETIATRPAAPTVTVEAPAAHPVTTAADPALVSALADELERRRKAEKEAAIAAETERMWATPAGLLWTKGGDVVLDSRTGPPVPSHPSGPSSADAIGTEPVASVPLAGRG